MRWCIQSLLPSLQPTIATSPTPNLCHYSLIRMPSLLVPAKNKMTEITITGWSTRDVRFPTSLDKTGSDAMNAAGDYSSAYCILETDSELTGHGMVSTLQRPEHISR